MLDDQPARALIYPRFLEIHTISQTDGRVRPSPIWSANSRMRYATCSAHARTIHRSGGSVTPSSAAMLTRRMHYSTGSLSNCADFERGLQSYVDSGAVGIHRENGLSGIATNRIVHFIRRYRPRFLLRGCELPRKWGKHIRFETTLLSPDANFAFS